MKEKMKMISLLLVSTVVVSWGAININIPAMAEAFDQVPLFLIENLATVSSLFIMISVLLSHWIAKKLGYKQTILIGLVLVGFSGVVPLFFTDFYIIFICRALLGVGIGMFQPLLVTMNKFFFTGERRTRMFGLQSAFEGVGGITFTFVSGQLVKSGWQSLFYIYLIVIPVFLLFSVFVPSISVIDIEPFRHVYNYGYKNDNFDCRKWAGYGNRWRDGVISNRYKSYVIISIVVKLPTVI